MVGQSDHNRTKDRVARSNRKFPFLDQLARRSPYESRSVDLSSISVDGVGMAFVAQRADGETIRYVDGKRYLWLASLTAPVVPMVGVLLYFATNGNPLTAWFPLLYTFVLVPLLDHVFGEDTHNPPEEVVPLMAQDNYY